MADHLAGEPTDRKHAQPSREGLCSESLPAKPRESQSVFASLCMSPMKCLHRDSVPACEDVPSRMNKTALKTHERLTERDRARHLDFNYTSTIIMNLFTSRTERNQRKQVFEIFWGEGALLRQIHNSVLFWINKILFSKSLTPHNALAFNTH